MPLTFLVELFRHGGWHEHSRHALLADALVMLRQVRALGHRARVVSRA